MKWEEVIKNQIAVTTGKTKTVDQPLVEDEDDDCARLFSDLFNRLSKKAAPIFKSISVLELSPSQLLNMFPEEWWCHFKDGGEVKLITKTDFDFGDKIWDGFTIRIGGKNGRISFNFREMQSIAGWKTIPFSLQVVLHNYEDNRAFYLNHDSDSSISFSRDIWIVNNNGKNAFAYGKVATDWTFPFKDSIYEFYLDILVTMRRFGVGRGDGAWDSIDEYIRKKLYAYLYGYIIYQGNFDRIIDKDFKKSVARTVTTGKTKTVDQPLYEEPDEDCYEYFSREIIEPFVDLAFETMPNDTRMFNVERIRDEFTPEEWCALWYEGELYNETYDRFGSTHDKFLIILPESHQFAGCYIFFDRSWYFTEDDYKLHITAKTYRPTKGVYHILDRKDSFKPEQIGLAGYIDEILEQDIVDEVVEHHKIWIENHLRSYENWRYKISNKITKVVQFTALSLDRLLDLWPATFGGNKW